MAFTFIAGFKSKTSKPNCVVTPSTVTSPCGNKFSARVVLELLYLAIPFEVIIGTTIPLSIVVPSTVMSAAFCIKETTCVSLNVISTSCRAGISARVLSLNTSSNLVTFP